MSIEMDFLSNWQDIMIGYMTAEGLKFSSNTPKDLLIIRYFTYLRKKGGQTPRPRRIHKTTEFVYPPELDAGLNQLINALVNGKNISPYLSKKFDDISKIDGMFNDWGILHLHLGEQLDPNDGRHVERTGPLLFLYLTEEDAYLINVYKHSDWTDRSILQTVQNNWPQLIKPYVMHGALSLSHQYTEQQHAALRNAGITVLIELKDKNGDILVIAPPGLGITASKDALQDVRSYHAQVKEIHNIEEYVRENPQFLHNSFGENMPDPMKLKLVHESKKWSIVEQSTKTKIDL